MFSVWEDLLFNFVFVYSLIRQRPTNSRIIRCQKKRSKVGVQVVFLFWQFSYRKFTLIHVIDICNTGRSSIDIVLMILVLLVFKALLDKNLYVTNIFRSKIREL